LGRKESIADSDVESHLSSSLENSSLREEMERRHRQQQLLVSGPASSVEESQSETEDGASGRTPQKNTKGCQRGFIYS